ncbi:ABC transporter substrate-binding protein [Microbacterium immunditiarum]|uniref:Peptide/nickel transport system substrate-binding protein n=1 Tax=Microbacterium immunditiarum TaxID=337480 RepID=A0A7Y9KIA0_9MICO|nr:ABC transporter substrate-binding protein [Microbacterium immunditiarum]NYE18381.1 peptide/nickel transport system substrate-binding protein [Microbacterium immunditiarum]
MNRTRALAILSVALVTPLALAGCSTGTPSGNSGASDDFAIDGTFSVAIAQDPGDLNPLLTNLVAAQVVNAFAYESLVFVDPETSEMQPLLAESWEEVSPTEVNFTIKDGITCSDGSEFTAETAAANFNWIVDEANGSPLRDSIIPSSAVATAEGNVVTVEVPEPKPFLLNNLGGQAMVCDAGLEDPSSVSAASNGTGLFEITEVVANDHVTLTRRDGYSWGPEGFATSDTPGAPKTVTVKVVTDASTTANLLLSKGLNAAVVSGADEARLADLDYKSSPNLSGELIFNHLAGVSTADVEVRTALTQAADLDSFTDIITGGKGERATSLITVEPKTCAYDSIADRLPEYDEDAAAATLEDAGWAKNADGVYERDGQPLHVTLVYNNTTDTVSAASEYLATQWENLGVEVELKGGDQGFLVGSTFAASDPSGWNVSVGLNLQSNTPEIFIPYLSGPTIPEGTNFPSIDNQEYVDLTAEASLEVGDAACDLWKQAEQALFDAVDIIPVSVTPYKMYFNGATSLVAPVAGILPAGAIRVLK